jgi:hypothetical protein
MEFLMYLITTVGGIVIGVMITKPLERLWERVQRKARFLMRGRIPLSTPFQFAFGPIKTALVVVDGDGVSTYTEETLVRHYDPSPITLPLELGQLRDRIAEAEQSKMAAGEPYMWNGSIYALKRYTRGRTDAEDHLVAHLWFGPTDWYTAVATNFSMNSERVLDPATGKSVTIREKYASLDQFKSNDFQPIIPFSNTFSVNICLISSDDRVLLVKRSREVAIGKGIYSIAINEGAQRPVDRSDFTDGPNPFRVAARGAAEELGLELQHSQITFLTLVVDTGDYTWSLHGVANASQTMDRIIKLRPMNAKDKWEGTLYPLNFDCRTVVEFVNKHRPWSPGGLACLYYTLVHRFGKREVQDTILDVMGP